MAAAVERLGGVLRFGDTITNLSSNGKRVAVTLGEGIGQTIETFDRVVVCAGVASRAFAQQLGDRVNIYPVKGYSITVNLLDTASQQGAPTVSLLDDETKLVTSRLGLDRFRVAGTAEFNGFNKDIRADRIRPLVDWVNQCFPQVSTRQVVPWAGLRPMTPSMMPRVGPGKQPNVFYNTGHGHLGWTLSAATAEALAETMMHSVDTSGRITIPPAAITQPAQA